MKKQGHYPPRHENYVFHGVGHIINIQIDDLKHIAKNAVVLIIVFGLAVVPCMYSYFNIAASWAPYDNVDKLKVAVANNDEGYKSDLLPIRLNIGMFSGEDINPVIKYYTNQKLNAVSPKVTDKASAALQEQIDKAFAETASNALISVFNTIDVFFDEEQTQSLLDDLDDRMGRVENNLVFASETVNAYTAMIGSLTDLMEITQQSLDSQNLMNSAGDSLAELQSLLDDTSGELQAASVKLENCIREVKEAADSEDIDDISELLSQNTDLLASLWASPVEVETVPVFGMENYGSSMAPFYTALSLWVGGTIMVAMMKVNISEEKKKALEKKRKVTHTEQYFGRLGIFLIIGFLQSTIIGLVDLYVLGVQHTDPFLFMLACWLSSFIYVMLIYTLTISFGDAGKAVAVILMVIQVAGSGGTFPIELAPDVFRNLYPLLPFVHTMDALRECIAGMYRNDYWIEMGTLALYLIPILILGLVLRRPVIRLNHFIEEKLEEVKFI